MLKLPDKSKQGSQIMQKPEINFISQLALQAGKILREMHRQKIDVQYKSEADLVTAADKASETFIINQIKQNFSTHAIYAEESGRHSGNSAHQWYIDPLDGTLNYAHGLSFFSVSIGYAVDGQLELGAIYDPLLDELFTAQRGQGTFVNGKRMYVSKTDQLIDSLLVTGFKHSLIDTPQANFKNFIRLSRQTQGVRRLGSAALDIAYVAAGRLDGYWEISTNPWDIAAGALMVQESGGMVTGLYGEPDFIKEPVSILAANPTMHKLILSELIKEQ